MTRIRVEPLDAEYDAADDETVMGAAVALGYYWPTTCGGEGRCTTCACLVLSGLDQLSPRGKNESRVLSDERGPGILQKPVRLACQAQAYGDVVLEKPGVRPPLGMGAPASGLTIVAGPSPCGSATLTNTDSIEVRATQGDEDEFDPDDPTEYRVPSGATWSEDGRAFHVSRSDSRGIFASSGQDSWIVPRRVSSRKRSKASQSEKTCSMREKKLATCTSAKLSACWIVSVSFVMRLIRLPASFSA